MKSAQRFLRARCHSFSRRSISDLGNNLLDACDGFRQNPLACHPGRLWSLWDLINTFDAKSVCKRVAELGWVEVACSAAGGGVFSLERVVDQYRKGLTRATEAMEGAGFRDSLLVLQRLQKRLGQHPPSFAAIGSDAATARTTIVGELDKRHFLYVAEDRVDFVGTELFGSKVFNNFETARPEVQSAGECLAAECSTACVFHLMRVAEIGLRALAYDREVRVFKNARTMFEIPLELATWDQLIVELEEAERAIQGFPQTLAREAQFAFYHGALMQYRAFKNVFRNSIMHTRDSYDRDEALSVFNKVKEFMGILASRIKENERTPTIWTTP